MEILRKPFQGIFNIIRFNWHFYLMAVALLLTLLLTTHYSDHSFQSIIHIICILVALPMIVSLLVSYYVYDLSELYHFNWIAREETEQLLININAGFDETSALLQQRFKNAILVALDFYDPAKHTEVSIKRARAAYPAFPGTKQVPATNLPLPDDSADKIFVIFSAHEIRNENERADFFRELKRVLKPTGRIFITEHLRDIPNFFAYNIGFFHFYSKASWINLFNTAGLSIKQELKHTAFISTFILEK
ncbi:MAG: class I SAM-dependent methyltransferase [Chitinophagaceae bacterium]|nr:class I SAM-dependent methyltransferase [Chitinophagaceae bacterium]